MRFIFSYLDYFRVLIDSINFLVIYYQNRLQKTQLKAVVRSELVFLIRNIMLSMRFTGNFTTLVIRLAPYYNQCLKPIVLKPSIVNQHCIMYHLWCDLCHAGYVGYTLSTFFNMLLNTSTQQLGNIFLKLIIVFTYWMRALLVFWGSIRANSIVYYLKCFTSRNSSLLWMPKQIQYMQKILFISSIFFAISS